MKENEEPKMKIPQNCKPGALLRKGVSVLGAALVAGAVCAANVVTHEAPRFSLTETPAAGGARLLPAWAALTNAVVVADGLCRGGDAGEFYTKRRLIAPRPGGGGLCGLVAGDVAGECRKGDAQHHRE